MAIERGYESQVAPQAPPPPVMSTPEDFGGGIGHALEQIGAQAHQNELRAFEIEQRLKGQREHTQWAVNFANWTADIDGKRAEMEAKPADGAAGHTQAMQDLLAGGDKLLEGVTDPATRQAAEVQLAQYRAQQLGRAEEFQVAAGVGATLGNAGTAIGALRNRLQNSDGGDAAFAEASKQVGWLIGGLDIGEQDRTKLMREAGAQLALGRASALADRDPAALGKILDSGQWDALLTPQQMAQARQLHTIGVQQVAAQQRAQDAAASSAQREAQAQVMDRYAAIDLLIRNHETVSAKDLAQLLTDAKTAGVGAEDLTKIALLGEDAGARSVMANAPTRQLDDQFRALAAKRNAGQLTKGEDLRQLDRLDSELKARAERDGDSIGQLWKQGASGQVEALQQLAAMPVEQRARVAAQMGQDHLTVLASLPGSMQQTALEGARRRQADGAQSYLPQKKTQAGTMVEDREALRQAFRDTVGTSIYNQLSGADNVYEAALDYYVGSQARGGNQGTFRKDMFAKAVKVMFGATRRADGSWQGGLGTVRGRQVELPPRWNESEFDQRLSRYDFGAAGARYANGRPADKADVLANYQLLFDHAAPDGTHFYTVVDRQGRPLVRDTGHPFWLPVPAGPR